MHDYLHYFAYGSNLHPLRLRQRIGVCRSVCVARLRRANFAFNKRGLDESGKGNIEFVESASEVVGVLYHVSHRQKALLDDWESSQCGYEVVNICAEIDGAEQQAFTYVANKMYVDNSMRPFDWYKAYVVLGAAHFGFPAVYRRRLWQAECAADPDVARSEQNFKLIAEMREANRPRSGSD